MQHDRLTQAELDALPAKTKKHPEVVELYLHHDFLTAYAKHTDMRVAESPEGAIGAASEWETHGNWQRDFLILQGLKSAHRLLEIGCGTGRLARKVVPYLDAGKYVGVDLSQSAIEHAQSLAESEGWAKKEPLFYVAPVTLGFPYGLDFVWAFSVFIHLPEHEVRRILAEMAGVMTKNTKFLFSYVPEKIETRTGLKQFRHLLGTYKSACKAAGLSFTDIPWPHQQRIGLARRVDL